MLWDPLRTFYTCLPPVIRKNVTYSSSTRYLARVSHGTRSFDRYPPIGPLLIMDNSYIARSPPAFGPHRSLSECTSKVSPPWGITQPYPLSSSPRSAAASCCGVVSRIPRICFEGMTLSKSKRKIKSPPFCQKISGPDLLLTRRYIYATPHIQTWLSHCCPLARTLHLPLISRGEVGRHGISDIS